MAEDSDDKTEEPTGKRLSDARAKGQVISSHEVKNFFVLLGGLIMVSNFLPPVFLQVVEELTKFIAMPHTVVPEAASIGDFVGDSVKRIGLILVVPFLLMIVVAVASGMIQTGPMIAP